MRRITAIGFFLWVFLAGFVSGFACSRIHDSERVARMWSEARQARDKYHKVLMLEEKWLPGVKSDNRCRRDGHVIVCPHESYKLEE